jgi:hypothetical protein
VATSGPFLYPPLSENITTRHGPSAESHRTAPDVLDDFLGNLALRQRPTTPPNLPNVGRYANQLEATQSSGPPPRVTQTIRGVYDALASSGGDGEKLANAVKRVAGRQSIVSILKQVMRWGDLVQKSGELLKKEQLPEEPEEEKEVKLTCVCWRWMQPSS